MESRTWILIVDDHPVVISGVRRLLAPAPDFEVVGQASTAAAAVAVARSTTPDVILLDLHLPDAQPAGLCRTLRSTVPVARVVIFTAFVEPAVLAACLAAGVSGVLLKDAEERDLVGDLRRICSGQLVVDSRVQATLKAGGEPGPEGALTHREIEVLALLAEGTLSEEIAAALGIAPNTVRSYCQSGLFKLQATNRIQALARARARGLL